MATIHKPPKRIKINSLQIIYRTKVLKDNDGSQNINFRPRLNQDEWENTLTILEAQPEELIHGNDIKPLCIKNKTLYANIISLHHVFNTFCFHFGIECFSNFIGT